MDGVGAVPLTTHQKLFFWNKDGKLEMVEAGQSSYGIYVAFTDGSGQVVARTAFFKVEDSFYVNNKSSDKKDKFFCWD